MRILFCNIAWMKCYNGVENEEPKNGGSWVKENKYAIECHNFTPCDDGMYRGYVCTKSNGGNRNQLHIERFEGITKEDDVAKNVLVIWVAKRNINKNNTIVGWYKNATIFRNYQWRDNGEQYNIIAKLEDCILLPTECNRNKVVPRAGKEGYSYGMGQANVWFAQGNDDKEKKYVENMINYINSYDGENLALENKRIYENIK
ncbi:hypothetical protein [Clostridium sp.]|jgi:hypothetical protein|uniref:hypothetical protein n=1 Tax=Clostridium sp. TaxID=1506 RepID=UPI0025B92269|nr:hypothetical protein [Clostridium sp.]MCI9069740.1 hypothetical protein [Clostridium sp.]